MRALVRQTSPCFNQALSYLKDELFSSLDEALKPELMARDKVNLDTFWLRGESLVDDLEAALEQFRAIAEDLGE